MTSFLHPIFLALLLVVVAAPAAAEKADRGKPMEILADKSGSADLKNQVSRFSGNVVITQGTMVITADRVEVRQTPDGYHTGTAWGLRGRTEADLNRPDLWRDDEATIEAKLSAYAEFPARQGGDR